jgi:NADH:ubiquinone oxidoreductase subunit 2 (subunit N)
VTPLALLPSFALLCGAVVALVLEVVGTPPGARKQLTRVHLPWLVGGWCVAGLAGAWLALDAHAIDRISAVAIAALLVLLAITHQSALAFLRSIDEERGELSAAYLLFGAGVCASVSSTDLLVVGAGVALAGVAGAFLAAPDREGPHGIEAAARLIFALGLFLALLITAAAFSALASGTTDLSALNAARTQTGRVAEVLVIVLIASLAGAVPLQQRFVDVAHGSASSATGLLSASGLLVGGVLALRLVAADPSARLHDALAALALLSLVGAPLAALSQVRVGRLVAYLAATQVGVPLAALAGSSPTDGHGVPTVAVVVGAVAACTALLGVTLATRHPAATWEDWSGFGRARPVVAAMFIYALATCAGMPGTAGFLVRLSAARIAFARGDELLGVLCVLTVALAAAPVVRLALFLFAKAPPTTRRAEPDRAAVGFVLLAGVSALITVVPAALGWLARFIERGP